MPIALGETYYDPIYRAAEEEGVVLGIHGTRNTSRELGAATLSTFAEVHSYAFTAGILLQFTSMVCQGITERFPKLKLAFLEIGATWAPLLSGPPRRALGETRDPRDAPAQAEAQRCARESNMYFSLESGESQLAATVDYVGSDHFVYASDIPHWDNEFPENLHHLRNTRTCRTK